MSERQDGSHKNAGSAPGQSQVDASLADLGTALTALARETVGLRVNDQDSPRHAAWLQDRLDELGIAGLQDYARLLASRDRVGRGERERFSRQLTTGETYFFRDPGQFELLAQRILPELLARRADSRRLRIWSAGCATGEEAYSLAILIGELVPDATAWDIRILGTDINSAALGHARDGLFSEWSFRTLQGPRKEAHFRAEGRRWRISQTLRERVRFEQLDLVQDDWTCPDLELAGVDLILCRNVFIYMTAEATARVSARLSGALAEGGYLVTGHGELLGHHTPGLHPKIHSQAVVLHKTAAESAVPVWQAPAPGLPAGRPATRSPWPQTPPPAPVPVRAETAARGPALAPEARARPLLREAWQQADQGQTRAAENACRLAIAEAPLDPWPYYLLAQLAQERGDTGEARAQLSKVIYLDPNCVAAYLELATLFEERQGADRNRPLLETARRLLAALPPQAQVQPYGQSTAADVLSYVERLLNGDAPMARLGPDLPGRAS